ncbi:methylated-DNA--protein-cysteine methyltransferase-like [Patiria miniata]|uniref:Methylated-DNA--protein-cysteine methyltransferase n=1 Tax=Patiria miniata TaxID=46514 RepID=A0A914B3Z6_PATMI|nr:methylated-DNA--protein-cysteine methyltransferase-like [Patiria miniata]XP_038070530.1 methylated-DNA--protein-cysteine methyltransferase-like [Patiria miniata]XP_038070531.1 methylated-DNA--protein-cysteine methyltransferase-like [Patiria miniata]XP_038070532.1 methylated-DNA--protein-cysteine methyltransferase-like [Patiria miniata]XP_038070533.1 methylated-DNA--protein-cysteine methyltransferase-like [Patiria miniata]XP_038070534.1 methylated-DNA--protein-cysteine methyltransferase-like
MAEICLKSRAVLRTPIGPVSVTACKTGVHNINLTAATEIPGKKFAVAVTEAPDHWPGPLRKCVDWLTVYFKDAKAANQMPLPPFHRPTAKTDSFTYKVWETLTNQVQCGETVSYGQLAAMAGNDKACRAVGGAMRANQIPILMPCHRVTKSDGALGNYMAGKGNTLKKWLLEHEGAVVK